MKAYLRYILSNDLSACNLISGPTSSQNYIARFGHGSAKLARQAQSKEKTLKKMVDGGLTERVSSDKVNVSSFIHFPQAPYHFSIFFYIHAGG